MLFNQVFDTLFYFTKSIKNCVIFLLTTSLLLLMSFQIDITPEQGITMLNIILFPFNLISELIREIAIKSQLGNAMGIMLFILISIIPLIIQLIIRRNNSIMKWVFRIILSFLIGLTLYVFINPSLIPNPIETLKNQLNLSQIGSDYIDYKGEEAFITQYTVIFKYSLVTTILMIILIYYSIQFYRYTKANKLNLYTGSNVLLWMIKLGYFFILILSFLILPYVFRTNWGEVNPKQIDEGIVKNLLVIKFVFIYSTIVITYLILRTLHDLLQNFVDKHVFAEKNVTLFHHTSIYCIFILLNSILFQFINNTYQLLNARHLLNLSTNFSFPITELILALAFYLLSLYMKQAYKIYKENQLTI